MLVDETPVSRKARGAFYTPREIAAYLVNWAIGTQSTRVLEPSAGDGVFLGAAAARICELGGAIELVGVELVPSEASIARERARVAGVDPLIVVSDFFALDHHRLGQFGSIVGNPPWIRYHGFTGAQRDLARQRAAEMRVEISGLASSWASYVVHATSFLAPDGRLALVLPAELLQVDYAASIRRFLVERFQSVRMIAFDSHVFADAEVDAVLLLASQDDLPGVTFERVRSIADIGKVTPTNLTGVERWTTGIVSSASVDLLQDLEATGRMTRLGNVGSVDIGIVTGCNEFFVVSDPEAEEFGLADSDLRAIVTRSDQLLDGVVSADHIATWRSVGRKTRLLTLGRQPPNGAGRYVAEGDRLGVSSRYKCRMRSPWYSVPLKAPPDLFLSYMAHLTPRMAWNQAQALSTNLIHGVYLKTPDRARAIAESWGNPATALSAELEGRTYGGGVLKLETREAERVLVPVPDSCLQLTDIETAILHEAIAKRRQDRMGRRRVSAS